MRFITLCPVLVLSLYSVDLLERERILSSSTSPQHPVSVALFSLCRLLNFLADLSALGVHWTPGQAALLPLITYPRLCDKVIYG